MTDEFAVDRSGHTLEVFACPKEYVPSRFFKKYNKAYVPPIYYSNLADIARSTQVDALRLWGWTFDQLNEQIGNRSDAHEFGRYVSDHRDGFIPCGSSVTTEVFKSAYLRVLEALASANVIDESTLHELSATVCPLDVSLWEIGSKERPKWWPEASKSPENLQSSDDWERTAALPLTMLAEGTLIFAEGPLIAEKEEFQVSHFSMVPFAYRVIGKQLPSADRIFDLLRQPSWTVDSLHPKLLSIFDVPLPQWTPDNHEGVHVGDLLLLPMLGRIHSTNINCWQYWRGIEPLVFPSVPLAIYNSMSVGPDSWGLESGGNKVFSGFSWLNGPLRRMKFRYEGYGQFAVCDLAWLQAKLDRQNLKLAFVLRHTYRIRKSEYSEHETTSFTKLLQMSEIITSDLSS